MLQNTSDCLEANLTFLESVNFIVAKNWLLNVPSSMEKKLQRDISAFLNKASVGTIALSGCSGKYLFYYIHQIYLPKIIFEF